MQSDKKRKVSDKRSSLKAGKEITDPRDDKKIEDQIFEDLSEEFESLTSEHDLGFYLEDDEEEDDLDF